MIYIRTRCPSAINVAPSSRMHFIFKEQAHPLRSTPRRCFSFLALSSFQVRCAVPTTCVIIFQHTQSYHASHAITSSLSCLPRSLRVWIHITWLFCIRMSPRCNAFCVSHHFAVLVREWDQQPLSSSDVFVPPASICFCDRSLSLSVHFPPIPEVHTASHTRQQRRLSMRLTDLNQFFRSFCFVGPYYTSCSITCSFPRYSVLPISSLQCVFLFLSLPSTFTEH
jgi:hypothetical protein